MTWTKRMPERLYAAVMWIISLVLAGFLIGLGGILIGDLRFAEEPLRVESFAAPLALGDVDVRIGAISAELNALNTELHAARADVQTESNNYASAYESFQNWLATRTATTDPDQDPEVISRSAALDVLKARERGAEQVVEGLQRTERELRDGLAAANRERAQIVSDARPAFERAVALQDMRVFMFRLALTLPLLMLGFWFVAKQRKSKYWPLMRGFTLFAVFVFFVELVPYLPSYGGYIRYGVGIIVTILASHYVIKWMRHYLENRKDVEKRSEQERRRALAYEDALKKIGEKVCPGCDRKILTTDDATADFCVHCGMTLYDHCANCETRKVVFFQYCMKCGTPGAMNDDDEARAGGAEPAPA